MIASEFRTLLADSNLTHYQLATRLGIDVFDLFRYETGVVPIPPLVEFAVLWIIKIEQAEVFLSGN